MFLKVNVLESMTGGRRRYLHFLNRALNLACPGNPEATRDDVGDIIEKQR